ncbi:hypothetical protein PG997_001709 [Apiospora hydei]|uniref:Uncharacterized protein n=1 Tax=Apiospora hydei TaxID=1337664 RepID=A0ABR1XEH5_9PEZI
MKDGRPGQDAAPLDANGKPFPAVWVQVAETSYYCYADNCARAVTGTRTAADMPNQSVRMADCSSYMTTTVTPPPTTTTTTVTVTAAAQNKRVAATAAGRGAPPAMQARAPPAMIPTYASFCTESFPGATPHYSSACNCWSITASTTTLPSSTHRDRDALAPCKNPQTCQTFGTTYCPGSSTEFCYCVKDTSGTPTCYHYTEGRSCSSFAKCTSNAQCTGGTSCSTDWCCGYGICMDHTTSASCPNGQSARSIFCGAEAGAARDAVVAAAAAVDTATTAEEDEGEPAVVSVITSVIMCPHGPCGTTTVTASTTTTTPPPAKATTPMAFAARGRRGNAVTAVEAAAISITTSVITCPHGICGTTTMTMTTSK